MATGDKFGIGAAQGKLKAAIRELCEANVKAGCIHNNVVSRSVAWQADQVCKLWFDEQYEAGRFGPPVMLGWGRATKVASQPLARTLLAKAEEQVRYWQDRQEREKCPEDAVDDNGECTPIGDVAAWRGGYCSGRYSEADWWLKTLQCAAHPTPAPEPAAIDASEPRLRREQEPVMTETAMIKRVICAMDEADHGHSIHLKSMADEGCIYTLDLQDGSEILEFPSHEDAYQHAERYRAMARARAATAEALEFALGRVDVFASMEPEEDETWESWYVAAFDMLYAELTNTSL